MKIDAEYFVHIRIADDILHNTLHELQRVLQELADESENQGLKMNQSKTKEMMENDTAIYVNNIQIENDESYIYVGQIYNTREKNKTERFKEESRLGGQHSPSSATSSKITLEHD